MQAMCALQSDFDFWQPIVKATGFTADS